jgi:threonine dehydratase
VVAVAIPLASEREEAARAIARAGLLRTPLIDSAGLSEQHGCEVRLKLECHQLTGSFKVRGALAAVARVSEGATVVTASAGNHGLGIAYACSRLGRSAEIFVPRDTDRAKVDALHRFGATVRVSVVEGTYDDTELAARRAAARPDTAFVSSYNDPLVVAGQSTVAMEALEQWPDADTVVVPVGGGGLLSGVALACAERGGAVSAWGVEPRSSPAVSASLEQGRIVRISEDAPSAAQGLIGNLDPDSITFALVRDHAAGVLLAGEEQLLGAVARIYADHAIVVEPSGGAALCGLGDLAGSGARKVICVVSGSNVAAASHFRIIAGRPPFGCGEDPTSGGKSKMS